MTQGCKTKSAVVMVPRIVVVLVVTTNGRAPDRHRTRRARRIRRRCWLAALDIQLAARLEECAVEPSSTVRTAAARAATEYGFGNQASPRALASASICSGA